MYKRQGIAKDIYGYDVSVLDLRNPACSDGNNLLDLVNKYMDAYMAVSYTHLDVYKRQVQPCHRQSGADAAQCPCGADAHDQ